jgi:aspartyl-tRNA(Asn)/glutamyl-tRNA(Gln) amidotransferase subunit A
LNSYASLNQIQQDIKSGKTTCLKLVESYLENIENNKGLNVFLEIFAGEALIRAGEIDSKISAGEAGRLAGMVISIKDLLCLKDHKVQASSRILEGFESQFTGTAVQRLLDEDAIIIGRTNCDEFAMGSSNENSAFGPVLNGIDHERAPGGSSGGAAVSVQMNFCHAALGSDTGGSVRQPAAFCGVIGLKPTYSRISRHGLIAYASSFDTIGIFSRSIADNALLLEIMAGEDEFDSTVSRKEVPKYSKNLDFNRKTRVAYIQETLDSDGLNEEVRQNMLKTIGFLKEEGHQVDQVQFPLMKYALPTYYILITAEASSNLSRFDGVKFGFRSPNTIDVETLYKKTRSEGFGQEVKRRIMLGTFVLSASYYDAYYTKAQRVRRLIREKTRELLATYDFLILPTTPTTAFKLGEKRSNPIEMYLADLFTVQASVAGVPAISIPNGHDSQGLPLGLQVMADLFEEQDLYAFSDYLLSNK